jgi:hypothetical protein
MWLADGKLHVQNMTKRSAIANEKDVASRLLSGCDVRVSARRA